MHPTFRFSIAAVLIGLLVASAASADTLRLKDGTIHHGRKIGVAGMKLAFKIDGKMRWFDMQDVAEVTVDARGKASPAPKSKTKAKRPIDLLHLIDAGRDPEFGQWRWHDNIGVIDFKRDRKREPWRMDPNGLICTTKRKGLVNIRYELPREYDLEVKFKRIRGDESIFLLLHAGGKQGRRFAWTIGAFTNTVVGFGRVNGKTIADEGNPARKVVPGVIKTGKVQTMVVKVRNDSLAAYVDKELLCRHMTDLSDMDVDVDVKRPARFSLGCWNSETKFYSVGLTGISGKGKRVIDEKPWKPSTPRERARANARWLLVQMVNVIPGTVRPKTVVLPNGKVKKIPFPEKLPGRRAIDLGGPWSEHRLTSSRTPGGACLFISTAKQIDRYPGPSMGAWAPGKPGAGAGARAVLGMSMAADLPMFHGNVTGRDMAKRFKVKLLPINFRGERTRAWAGYVLHDQSWEVRRQNKNRFNFHPFNGATGMDDIAKLARHPE